MKRKIYNELIKWKNDKENIKPLMLIGARQVGKTYIIREFCQNEFDNFVEINLLERNDIIDLYKNKQNSDSAFDKLQVLVGTDFSKKNTVLFIDEIQKSEELISELKYFCEKHSELRIIVAGSLLGVKLKRSHFPFPVGKTWILHMYPMDFEEFLWAFNQEKLINEIVKCYDNNIELDNSLHNMSLDYYRLFLITGGLPESVDNMVSVNKEIIKYNSNVLKSILESYINDMSEYVESDAETIKIQATYKSIPIQLGNSSHKFQYNKVSENAKSRDYYLPLDWLEASNLIVKSECLNVPEIPPELHKDSEIFKIYLNDVGLLNSVINSNYGDILTDNLGINKGIITENYVANELIKNGYCLYYWLSKWKAEIDFVIYTKDGLIPIEVKSSENTKSKSLNEYMERFNPNYAIRISTKNFGFDKIKKIKAIPLYATFLIKEDN